MAETGIKTETPADRMRTAVKRLRCDHTYPVQPPHGSLAHPGPCRHCGMPYPADDEWVPETLRGTLVFLLEETARLYDMPPCDKPDGACNRCERRDEFVYANALAQLINGGGRG